MAWRGGAEGKSIPLVSWVPGRGKRAVSTLYLGRGSGFQGSKPRHLVVQSLCRAEGMVH